jgi:HlyD family secretion protein
VAGGTWILLLKPVEVQVVKTEQNVPIQVFGLGTVEAQIVSQIGFETAGTLVELHADHGDSVKEGAVLARLDSREQEARAAQARAAVTQAEAAIEQATANVERAEALLKEKTLTNERRQELVQREWTSQQVADEAQAAADMAKADVAQTRSAVAFEEARLAKFSLYAPYDGLVIKRHRELGSALNANEQVFTLVDPATIWGLTYIDEARAGSIEIGQPAEVIHRSAPERRISATIVRVEIESDRVNEEYRVYVRCGGCPLPFHLGEQIEVRITVARLPRARLVKMNSLMNINGRQATAWTVENGRLQQRKVALGHRTLDGRVEIVSGVPDGAEIVDGPIAGLEVGRKAAIVAGETGK